MHWAASEERPHPLHHSGGHWAWRARSSQGKAVSHLGCIGNDLRVELAALADEAALIVCRAGVHGQEHVHIRGDGDVQMRCCWCSRRACVLQDSGKAAVGCAWCGAARCMPGCTAATATARCAARAALPRARLRPVSGHAPCDFLSVRYNFSYSSRKRSRLLSPASSVSTCQSWSRRVVRRRSSARRAMRRAHVHRLCGAVRGPAAIPHSVAP